MTTAAYTVRPCAQRFPDGQVARCRRPGETHRGASMREAAEAWAAAGFLPDAEAAVPEQPIALDLSAITILPSVGFFEFTSPARPDWTLQVTAHPA